MYQPIKAQFPSKNPFSIYASYIYVGNDSIGKPKYLVMNIHSDNAEFGFDKVFARQIEALCGPDDLVVGISTSGNSENVVVALEYARANGIASFAFTGGDGGRCAELADLALLVPSPITARVQECHLIAGHLICDMAELAFEDQVSTLTSSAN